MLIALSAALLFLANAAPSSASRSTTAPMPAIGVGAVKRAPTLPAGGGVGVSGPSNTPSPGSGPKDDMATPAGADGAGSTFNSDIGEGESTTKAAAAQAASGGAKAEASDAKKEADDARARARAIRDAAQKVFDNKNETNGGIKP